MRFFSLARASLALLAVYLAPVVSARAQQPSIAGFWQSYSDEGPPNGWFYFAEKDGVFEGRLVKQIAKPGEEGKFKTCEHCTGALKGAPMLGLPIVTNMKRQGLAYEDGNVLDPRDGSVYDARIDLSPDGQKLSLRGYLGLSILGQTKIWTRLPDNSMPLDKPPIASAATTTTPVTAPAAGATAKKRTPGAAPSAAPAPAPSAAPSAAPAAPH
jgi:uncharacterized protein (DUF2147 family)